MSDPELAPLPDLGLGGDSENDGLPDLGLGDDPLNEAIAELQDVLDKDQAMGSFGDGDEIGPAAAAAGPSGNSGLQDLVMSLPVQVDVVIGSADMPVADLIGMETGSVVVLNRKIGELVDICVNGTKIASGEIETLEDDPSRLGVRIVSLVKS